MISHPAGLTHAVAIIFAALGRILAFAFLTTIWPVVAIRTRHIARGTCEAGHTLTLTVYVITFTAILARTLQRTIRAKSTSRARMLTGQPNVSGATDVVAGYVITSFVTVDDSRTIFTTAMAVCSFGTNLRTVIADPATRTDALACQWIAGGVI